MGRRTDKLVRWQMSEFWVFGYGSLMWNPGFDHIDRARARLHGAHRQLCVYSFVHRGTAESPGLVMGLDVGGACTGAAYRVAPENWADTVEYLRAREQVTMVYREVTVKLRLLEPEPRDVMALCYKVDRTHEQYAGNLPIEEQLNFVRQGVGRSGANPEYVKVTVEHMRESGIRDSKLEELVRRLQA